VAKEKKREVVKNMKFLNSQLRIPCAARLNYIQTRWARGQRAGEADSYSWYLYSTLVPRINTGAPGTFIRVQDWRAELRIAIPA